MNQYRCLHNKQHGAALIVSLMLLLIMTLIGVSSIGTTSLEERMAHNYQNSTVMFQANQSAINTVITSGHPDDPFYVEENDPLVAAMNRGIGNDDTEVVQNMDPDDHLANITLTSTSTVVYIGDNACTGMSVGTFICRHFDITSVSIFNEANNRKTHLQGIYAPSPGL